MRHILQTCLSQTKAHFLHSQGLRLACRHVATHSRRTSNEMYPIRNTHGALPQPYSTSLRGTREHFGLIKICRLMSKSSRSESRTELSLDDVKMQLYLRKLRERHEAALKGQDEARAQEARRQMPLMVLLDQMDKLQSDIKELFVLAENNEGDKEMQEMAREELQEIRKSLLDLQEKVFSALTPEEPMDGRNVVLEVSAGVGGQEAMLFCQEVFEMYSSYAQLRGWQQEVTDYETTDIGGLRHGSLVVSGEGVYSSLKYEGGIHRVQRVPKTEKAGRVHTSTISVAVMPQPLEIDIQLLDKDLKIETKKASGAGGQHVNTTDSAVRIKHIPTGLVVESQTQRSQHYNKENCLKKLRTLLYQQQLEQDVQSYNTNRRLQVGTKGRSEKIRTYNFPQDRVTDHRLGLSMHNLTSFMSGGETFHGLVSHLVQEGQRETLEEIMHSIKT